MNCRKLLRVAKTPCALGTGRFTLDEASKRQIVKEDARSAEFIKPWLDGHDIRKWYPAFDRKYLIEIASVISTLLVGILLVLEACNQSATSSTHTPPKPQVLEKDIPDLTSKQSLTFQLSIGDRVEGVATVVVTDYMGKVLSTVGDPYGNALFQSSNRTEYRYESRATSPEGAPELSITSQEKYPWRFAFFPAVEGKYALEVKHVAGDMLMTRLAEKSNLRSIISVHVKVTIYPK